MSRPEPEPESVPIDMTPMIDIVFQLLTFFVMTFRIAQAEGNFDITMPRMTAPGRPSDMLPPLKVTLRANDAGGLAEIRFADHGYESFRQLHAAIAELVGPDRGPGSLQQTAEVELDCDPRLNYVHVIEAVTAVSGEVGPRGELIKLVEKIRFTPH